METGTPPVPVAIDNTILPVVVPASGSWDGNDGPWSTFDIHVGTPQQSTRVLVSNSFRDVWVAGVYGSQSPDARGGLVDTKASSTWHVDLSSVYLGFTNYSDYQSGHGYGDIGSDAMGLGLPGFVGKQFRSVPINVVYSLEPYIGFMGLTPGYDYQGLTTFFQSLKDFGVIPSLSYGYSAGALYRQNTTATLTLGGYDESKFVPNDSDSFRIDFDNAQRSFVVGLKAILFNKNASINLLPNAISTSIDPTVSQIWLPHESCSLFEEAFGITYDSTVDRYLVNELLHSRLRSENASVSFLIGKVAGETATTTVVLPYSSFDLEIGPPTVNHSQRYFPLRRADNESQYILGRAFLQEAYIIADYERLNFSIYQSAWDPNAEPHIVTIATLSDDAEPKFAKLLGVFLGPLFFLILYVWVAIDWVRRRRAKKEKRKLQNVRAKDFDPFHGKIEMDGKSRDFKELDPITMPAMADTTVLMEMQGCDPDSISPVSHTSELRGGRNIAELKGTLGAVEKSDGKEGPVPKGNGMNDEIDEQGNKTTPPKG